MRLHSSRRALALAVFAALNAADIATTHIGLAAGYSEASPVPSMILSGGGELTMYGLKVAVCALVAVAVLTLRQYPRLSWALYATSAILALVVVNNLSLIVS
jgi:hypothetical protein